MGKGFTITGFVLGILSILCGGTAMILDMLKGTEIICLGVVAGGIVLAIVGYILASIGEYKLLEENKKNKLTIPTKVILTIGLTFCFAIFATAFEEFLADLFG